MPKKALLLALLLIFVVSLISCAPGSEHFRFVESEQKKEQGYVGYIEWCQEGLTTTQTIGRKLWVAEIPSPQKFEELEKETFDLAPLDQCSFDSAIN